MTTEQIVRHLWGFACWFTPILLAASIAATAITVGVLVVA